MLPFDLLNVLHVQRVNALKETALVSFFYLPPIIAVESISRASFIFLPIDGSIFFQNNKKGWG